MLYDAETKLLHRIFEFQNEAHHLRLTKTDRSVPHAQAIPTCATRCRFGAASGAEGLFALSSAIPTPQTPPARVSISFITPANCHLRMPRRQRPARPARVSPPATLFHSRHPQPSVSSWMTIRFYRRVCRMVAGLCLVCPVVGALRSRSRLSHHSRSRSEQHGPGPTDRVEPPPSRATVRERGS